MAEGPSDQMPKLSDPDVHTVSTQCSKRDQELDRLHEVLRTERVVKDGATLYYVDGQLHRVYGPAVITATGQEYWYRHGKLDRADGPAVVGHTYQAWLSKGEYHRIGGAAVMYDMAECHDEWWLFGVSYTQDDYWRELTRLGYDVSKYQQAAPDPAG